MDIIIGLVQIVFVFLFSLIIGIAAILFNVPQEDVNRYMHDHIYYFTCGTTAVGTAVVTKTFTFSFTTFEDFAVRLIILCIQVSITVTITFFLTKFLKYMWPDVLTKK